MTELPTPTYTWKLDTSTATKMYNTSSGEYFKSPLFKMHGFKWYIRFFPNYKTKQYVQLFIHMHSWPALTSKIIVDRNFELLETNTNYSSTIEFDKYVKNRGWPPSTLKSDAIQGITEFTIKLGITLTDVFDLNYNAITDKYLRNDIECNNKRDLNEANISNNPPKKRRKYSNNNNSSNDNNIDELIREKMEELCELQKEKEQQTKDFKSMYEKEKKENDSLNKSNKKMTNELQQSHKKMETFKKQIETLNQKISIYKGTSNNIKNNTLNLEQLNKFEQELMNGMQCIAKSRQKLLELQNKCIACTENNKNIVFIDGCNHCVLCMECENKMDAKQCPMCRTPYTNARKMNF